MTLHLEFISKCIHIHLFLSIYLTNPTSVQKRKKTQASQSSQSLPNSNFPIFISPSHSSKQETPTQYPPYFVFQQRMGIQSSPSVLPLHSSKDKKDPNLHFSKQDLQAKHPTTSPFLTKATSTILFHLRSRAFCRPQQFA